MKPFVEDLKAGRPLPPLMGIIGEERSMINEFRSEFRKLQDLQRVPEASMVSSGKDIIQMMASSGNSYLRLEAEDFIFKYWRYLWSSPRSVADEVITGLDAAHETRNRENLYTLLHRIQCDTSNASGEAEIFDIDNIIPHIVKDIENSNKSEPPFDTSGWDPLMVAAAPQRDEYISCAHALVCLVLRLEDKKFSWESLDLTPLSLQSKEGISMVVLDILRGWVLVDRAESYQILGLIDAWGIFGRD